MTTTTPSGIGLPTSIKVDAFDFQKYGLFDGVVKLISADCRKSEQSEASVLSANQQPADAFNVYITPKTKHLKVEGKNRTLHSGMTVVAEINVGKRRIIEFFLYPIFKNMREGISVR